MDINTYVNLWLISSKFSNKLKENEESKQVLIDFIKFMISNYDRRKYLYDNKIKFDDFLKN